MSCVCLAGVCFPLAKSNKVAGGQAVGLGGGCQNPLQNVLLGHRTPGWPLGEHVPFFCPHKCARLETCSRLLFCWLFPLGFEEGQGV